MVQTRLGLVGSKLDGICPPQRGECAFLTLPIRVWWSRGPTAPKIKNRMSNFLEPGQTATGTNEEEVRSTESQLEKDLLGEEREKKKQKENYDPPPPQHHTWCYLTSTQLLDYNKRFEESGGYDVGDVPYDAVDIPIKPVCLDSPKLLERMEKYSNLALEEHNRHNDTKYKFVKVLKATFSTGGARRYFITFQVKDMADPASPILNSFRARVYECTMVLRVKLSSSFAHLSHNPIHSMVSAHSYILMEALRLLWEDQYLLFINCESGVYSLCVPYLAIVNFIFSHTVEMVYCGDWLCG